MAAYLITGPNGSGKSTVGRALSERGYAVIEMDAEPGLSGWVDNMTKQKVTDLPPHPFSGVWLKSHSWIWFEDRLNELVASTDQPIFFCGGAYNQKNLYNYFAERFTLYLDDETTIHRLRAREPERWREDSEELAKTLDWNARSKQISIE